MQLKHQIHIRKSYPKNYMSRTQVIVFKQALTYVVHDDPQFYNTEELSLKIGADICRYVIRSGLFKPDKGTVVLQFGWTMSGTI